MPLDNSTLNSTNQAAQVSICITKIIGDKSHKLNNTMATRL